ncbi:putative autocrine proliferation repressor protein A [Apostichopus japonicus]|uniref:Putative autocrine proliferation repressor protein A n=1 Tax=Stichopus japonicus TaxID=307972 RepID=A0A2G8KNC4_STIJA|nr:putative autocrine proliferation repressor protein A [Apostichopus japonicus]
MPCAAPDPLKDDEVMLVTKSIVQTGIVGAVIRQVPNQPIVFPDDPRGNLSRYEDDIIAYTWRHFIEGGQNEPNWLLRFPMTKAVVRAMDTVTEYINRDISKFFVAGESKIKTSVFAIMMYRSFIGDCFFQRGWTTWTTGAMDKRVIAYIDRLTMPKYVVTASGDEFFLPDDSHYFYSDMQGPTYLRLYPFFHQQNVPFPQLSWDRYENATHGIIKFRTDLTPISVRAYQATTLSSERRDFRLVRAKAINSTEPVLQPVLYKPFHTSNPSKGTYVAEVFKPVLGWTCFFVVAEYPGPRGSTIRFTSESNIVPDVFPFPQCKGEGCVGVLV